MHGNSHIYPEISRVRVHIRWISSCVTHVDEDLAGTCRMRWIEALFEGEHYEYSALMIGRLPPGSEGATSPNCRHMQFPIKCRFSPEDYRLIAFFGGPWIIPACILSGESRCV